MQMKCLQQFLKGQNFSSSLRKWESFSIVFFSHVFFEIALILASKKKHFKNIEQKKIKMVPLFHEIAPQRRARKKNKIKCGIAVKPKTPWDKIEPYLDDIDQVIVMTVEPGFGGQVFMNDQINKIKKISEYIKSKNLDVKIEIDGGINYETGKKCIEVGANILVAGSFLFKQEDLIKATNSLYDALS